MSIFITRHSRAIELKKNIVFINGKKQVIFKGKPLNPPAPCQIKSKKADWYFRKAATTVVVVRFS